MILDDFNALDGLVEELRQEAYEIEDQIQNISRHIREAETYLQNLIGSESDDYKIFSPRKAEVIYKEEIEKIKKKIAGLEEQKKEICSKKAVLSRRIHTIENILGHYDADSMEEKENAQNLQVYSIESLNDLIHKIELSSTYVDRNPIQVKQDCLIISKCLQEVVDRIHDTVWMYK